MRSFTGWWLVSAALFVTGCGGSGSNNNNNPPPPVPPTVTSVTPTSGSTGVAVSSAIAATFSTAMEVSTITSSTFTLATQGGTAVSGTVTYASASLTATFTPSAPLANNTTYTATITTGATNSVGTALAANYSWSFTTAQAPAPTVTTVTPANSSTGIAVTSTVMATFSTAMIASTITSSTFTLAAQGGSAVTGTVSYNSGSLTATFTPNGSLANNTTYTATITTGAMASTGSALAANYTWSFTTAASAAPAPTVIAVTPANLSTDIALATPLTATFSTGMNASTITASTFTLYAVGGTAVQGIVSYNAATAVTTFTPAANLAYNTTYIATITTSAVSAAGTALASNYQWSFTTVDAPPPTIASTVPANAAVNVNISDALTAAFSQPMNSSTITASTFMLTTGPGNTAVSGILSYNAATSMATFTPSSALAYNTSYTATITTGAISAAGAGLASNYVWSFTTGFNPNQATVDFGTTYQTIRGFGGSTAWLGQLTTAQATALFSATNGLGLSILRVRIDPEGSASSNWVTGEWTTELANAAEVQSANSNAIVFASPWTPPVSMKTSSASQQYYSGNCSPAANYCGGYLNPSSYADYASYLEDFVTYFANNGVNLYAISMQNEPDYSDAAGENYESCSWTPQQMDTWVASLTANGATNPITTKLIMPESYNFNPSQSNPTLADPNAMGNVSIVGGHLYGTSPSYATNAEGANKDVWMTEHSLTPAGNQPAIGDALAMAQEIHNSMTAGSYNAYVWWWIWDNPNDGINYGLINASLNSPAPTYYGYAIGQFSEFIQPGYVRVSASANPVSGVYVSAYKGNGHFVIVVINSNSATQNLSFALNGGTVTSLTPYQTTSGGGLVSQAAVSVSTGQFNYTLPAQSIVTFAQ
jgi:O-glycosyl hydrolase